MQQSCSHSNAICNEGFHNRIELRTHKDTQSAEHQGRNRENQKTSKRAYPQPPHTRAALHRRLQLLYPEKHKVSCSGFLPNTSPMQHWCSHSNAICNQGFRNRIELRTHKDMQSAEHQGWNRQNLKTIKTSVPATASHTSCPSSPPAATLHGKNTRFCAPASTPTQAPCNIHAAITLRSATRDSTTAKNYAHTKTPPQHKPHATVMQPFQCDLQPGVPQPHRTTHTQRHAKCRTPREK